MTIPWRSASWPVLALVAVAAARAAGPTATTTSAPPLAERLRNRLYGLATEKEAVLEGRVRDAFARCLRRPKTLDIRFDRASTAQRLAGRFPAIRLSVRQGHIRQLRVLQGEMVIRDAILDYGALLDDGRLAFRDPGTIDFFLHLTQADINDMWRRRSGKIRVHAPWMELHDDWVRLHGQSKALLFKSPVVLRGRLAPHDSGKIYFHPRSMRLGFLPVPGFAVRKIVRAMNPIASFLDFDIPLAPTILRTVRGRLFLGTEAFRERIREAARAWGRASRAPPAAPTRLCPKPATAPP